uniref:PDZ domain-containing protein n=1 Tax=Leptocylindrus danicus TaxID=163516 RepID=A0A7S2JZ66_9STRA|mmetsp:Transcript_14721/g.21733  ORF Transcript_14721/g.21733 Transcript_14721/m.21733 type:complete len:207 (+) Transcript_14721:118-738(+)|eukprot:CAMPEP_0116020886 /NCGR_PEP_ID=MMETSP0321-20121206/10062_1 /TAXON_ID=163516 /ORGANISM="Leptocylindrus danicus var. danicus, Strain B650" /LENGTH=206 /DNA_ID=CAMNT_0003491659 /DNA_START=84 /DNA_END=704 /DNA_ORIENTATION=+
MKQQTTVLATLCYGASCASAFTFISSNNQRQSSTQVSMGLFDGVKDAFSAPPNDIDSEKETPIDRWMGWSAKGAQADANKGIDPGMPGGFIDAMDTVNYVKVALQKPMGIVFEENDEKMGGIYAVELKEGGNAHTEGSIKPGDQLVAVNGKKVSGLAFDDALGAIVATETESTDLLFFRGPANQLYGKTGASEEWLDEFISGKVEA